MQIADLSTPRKLAPLGLIIIFLQGLKKWGQVLIYGLIPFFQGKNEHLEFWMFGVFAAVVLAFGAVWSYLSWKNYFFHIKADKFVIKQGVLRKEESLIPLERIQTVHIKRNIVQQILGLAALQLDTAGSAKKEAEIPALKYEYATALKTHLLALKADEYVGEQTEGNQDTIAKTTSVEEEKILMKLGFLDILKVGLTENHFKSSLIILGIFFGYTTQFSEIFGYEEESVFKQVFTFLAVIIPLFVLVFFLISIAFSVWAVFMLYFDLTVSLKKSGLSVSSGLLKKEENFIPVNKIQYIKWKSNPLRKLIGFKSLAIYQAASAEVSRKKTVRVPGCKKHQQETVQNAFYPEYNTAVNQKEIKPDNFWLVRLFLFFVGIPLLLTCIAFFTGEILVASALCALAVTAVFFVYKYVQHFKAQLSTDLLVINKGFVFPEQVLLKTFKVQNVAVNQSVFQKQRKLVSIKVYTASGNLSIPYIKEKDGFELANKLLYAVESSNKEWM